MIPLLLLGGISAGDTQPYSHFGFCAQPVPPSCVAAKSMDPAGLSACEKKAERYVAMVFAYRSCLNAEMERAVTEANQVIRRLRCARDKRTCVDNEFDVRNGKERAAPPPGHR